MTKVCICKGISRASIKKAIKDGARTVFDIQRATGAGVGSCNGRRCKGNIQQLINNSANPQ